MNYIKLIGVDENQEKKEKIEALLKELYGVEGLPYAVAAQATVDFLDDAEPEASAV